MADRAARADEEFREYAAARAGQLFRIAFLTCGDWHDAEDLVQTTLAKLFAVWPRVQRSQNADSYARKVLINTYFSNRRLKRSSELPIAEPAERCLPGVDADLRLTLISALGQLPPRSRAVLVLRYVDDHSIEAVAQMLGVTQAAVKSLTTRGLAQLREALGADADILLS